jgi:hypothetical protein
MLMFEFVGLAHESAWIEESTREYLGMDGSTKEVGDAIAARVMQRRSQTVSR